jgi:glycosyltransferase involved in cell wall biosynthesis
VIFAGRFAPEKGVDILCRALPLTALPKGIEGEITFVGAGPEIHRPTALQSNAPAGWRVAILPPTPHLLPLLEAHDIAVVPSRLEGLGLVAVEAVRHGLAVVAADAPGLREVLPPDYPFFAPPNEPAGLAASLSRVCAHPAQWAAATASAQEFGRTRFDPDLMAAAYLRIYQQLAAGA